MPSKTITISAAKWERIKTAFVGLDPIPFIDDPNWIDPGDGTPPPQIPKYNDAEWVFIKIKKYVARLVRSYEQNKQGTDNAPAYDEDIISIE